MSEEKLAELEQDNNTHGYLYYSGAAKLVAEVWRCWAEIAKLKEQKTSKVQCDDLEHKPM